MLKFTITIEAGDPGELGRWLGTALAAVEEGVRDGKAAEGAPAPAGARGPRREDEPAVPAADAPVVQQSGGGPVAGGGDREAPGGRVRGRDVPAPAVSKGDPSRFSAANTMLKLVKLLQADGYVTQDAIRGRAVELHRERSVPVLAMIPAEDVEERVTVACDSLGID